MQINVEYGLNWDSEHIAQVSVDTETPEQELARSVIQLAFEDVERFMRGRKVPMEAVREALDFLTMRCGDRGLETWCIAAGIDFDAVRNMAATKLIEWNARGLQKRLILRNYTPAEEKFLRQYGHKGAAFCAKALGRPEHGVETKIRDLYHHRDREAA